ncbi:methionyl-tRNA formyltransferase [Nitzschia inconspicua]|uniref:Methionyl-tRNA formyltransferase, mitochondrial n=1 Tax=Nitzschia inconspicua TaxID=303405 RepID=A0A9K3KLT3_9STRA|nr:methionyl-tRNA formyltransferase [Nitzschia inconspicua]
MSAINSVRSFHPLIGSSIKRRIVPRKSNVTPTISSFLCISSGGRISTRENNPHTTIHWRLFSSPSEENNNKSSSGKKKIVFLGTPDVAATSLRKLYEASVQQNYEISCVITQPPKPRKRKSTPEPSPVAKVAEELGLQVLCPEKAKDTDFLDQLQYDIRPDLCITAAYGQYLPKRFLSTPTLGTVNIHPSLLPRWRGASPVQRSLEAGDNPVGVSVLYTVSKMDAGPIIAQQEKIIDENDTATKVLPLLFDIGTDLLLQNLPAILAGKITMDTAKVQDETNVVQAAMIDSAEAELKPWEESARQMHNRLRGFSMWPGAFLYLQVGEESEPTKFKILETRVLEKADDDTPHVTDQVTPGPNRKDGLRLVSFDGSILEILKLQPATKKPVDALSFINGLQGRTVRYVRTPEAITA